MDLAQTTSCCQHPGAIDGQCPACALIAYRSAMRAYGVPSEALSVYSSNSFRRVGLARQYREVLYPCRQNDGHLDISNPALLEAMVAAFNLLLVIGESLPSPSAGGV